MWYATSVATIDSSYPWQNNVTTVVYFALPVSLMIVGIVASTFSVTSVATILCCCFLATQTVRRVFPALTGVEHPFGVLRGTKMGGTWRDGDVNFLVMSDHYEIGDVVRYKVPTRIEPRLHRVIDVMCSSDRDEGQLLLTKGDWNMVDDRFIYPDGQDWLTTRDNIKGKVIFTLPGLANSPIVSIIGVPKLIWLIIVLVYLPTLFLTRRVVVRCSHWALLEE